MCSTEKLSEADANLPYFHGALMNIDADQLLVNEGDFMVTMKKQLDINKLVCTIFGFRAFLEVLHF